MYRLSSHLSMRRAARGGDRSFMVRYLVGIMVRIAAVLLSLTLVLALVPVRQGAFVAMFLGVVFLGITIEAVSLHRRGGLKVGHVKTLEHRD